MKIAITGGIGSGKSYVCKELNRHGIEVYDCDAAAKRLMCEDEVLRKSLMQLVGEEVYVNHVLQKPILAKYLLASETHKLAVNDIVHPVVARDFEQSGFDWLESAILFDSGFVHRTHFDFVVCVSAPIEVRVVRVMQRDHISREKTLEWIEAQLPQKEIIRQSDFEIINDGQSNIANQVNLLIASIKEKLNSK